MVSEKEILNKDFTRRHILSLSQFNPISLEVAFEQARWLRSFGHSKTIPQLLEGNVISLLIFEPSTRTHYSTEAAIRRLGGGCISITDVDNIPPLGSVSFEKSIIDAAACSDVIVIRHPEVGSAEKAAEISQGVPVINAGDGGRGHPTQTLQDLLTIHDHTHSLSSLRGLILGDPKNARTIRSLLEGLTKFSGNKIDILTLPEFQISEGEILGLEARGLKVNCIEKPESISQDCDFWYVTRIQWERVKNGLTEDEKRLVSTAFTITPEFLEKFKSPDMIILHPGPRLEEVSIEIDKHPCAAYVKKQVENGFYTRMAIICLVLGKGL